MKSISLNSPITTTALNQIFLDVNLIQPNGDVLYETDVRYELLGLEYADIFDLPVLNDPNAVSGVTDPLWADVHGKYVRKKIRIRGNVVNSRTVVLDAIIDMNPPSVKPIIQLGSKPNHSVIEEYEFQQVVKFFNNETANKYTKLILINNNKDLSEIITKSTDLYELAGGLVLLKAGLDGLKTDLIKGSRFAIVDQFTYDTDSFNDIYRTLGDRCKIDMILMNSSIDDNLVKLFDHVDVVFQCNEKGKVNLLQIPNPSVRKLITEA